MGSRKNSPARLYSAGFILASAFAFISAMFVASSSAQEGYVAAVAPEENTVVALGDSNTSGYGVNPEESYPARLQQNLRARGQAVRVINAGWGGDTFGAMLNRIDFSVPESAKLVIVQGGYNDLKNGVPREVTIANLDAILARLQARGIKTVLCGFLDKDWA
jgi:acyl-CoA thioesterase-1